MNVNQSDLFILLTEKFKMSPYFLVSYWTQNICETNEEEGKSKIPKLNPDLISKIKRNKKSIKNFKAEQFLDLFLNDKRNLITGDSEGTEELYSGICSVETRKKLMKDLCFQRNIGEFAEDNYEEFLTTFLEYAIVNRNKTFESQPKPNKISKDQPNTTSHLTDKLPRINREMLGREEELEIIESIFESGSNRVVIAGIGGMGKSLLSLKYANSHRQEYDAIQFVKFEKDIETTVNKLRFNNFNEDELNHKKNFEKKLTLLSSSHDHSLIVIDNIDEKRKKLTHLDELINCHCNFILTTRNNNLSEDYTINLKTLSYENQKKLFCKHIGYNDITDAEEEIMERIIKAVSGHTYAIELVAKTIDNCGISLEETHDLLVSDEIYNLEEEIITNKDISTEETTLKIIFTKLYDINQLETSEIEALRYLALIPISGIEKNTFCKFATLPNNNIINGLVARSWVQRARQGRKQVIWLHPLIVDVVMMNSPIYFDEHQHFFIELINATESNEDKIIREELYSIAYTSLTRIHLRHLSDVYILDTILFSMASIRIDKRLTTIGKKIIKQVKDMTTHDKFINEKYFILSKLENDLGLIYTKLGKYNKALSYFNDSVSHKLDLKQMEESLAVTYTNIATAYRKLSNYKDAVIFLKKAESIQERKLPADHPDMAETYNTFGIIYLNLGILLESENYYRKALKIRESNTTINPLQLAYSYNNLGTLLRVKNQFSDAVDYHTKGLEIRKKLLQESSLDIATSYSNIGSDYFSAKDYDNALNYINKAFEIRTEICGRLHPDTAWSYFSIGEINYAKKDYQKAETNYNEALAIRLNFVKRNHPYVAKILVGLGKTYMKLDKNHAGRLLIEEAASIYKKKYGPKHASFVETNKILEQLPTALK